MLNKESFASLCSEVALNLLYNYLSTKDVDQLIKLKKVRANVDGNIVELDVTAGWVEVATAQSSGEQVSFKEPMFVCKFTEPLYQHNDWVLDAFSVMLTGVVCYVNHEQSIKPLPPEYWVGGTLRLLRSLYSNKSIEEFLNSPFLDIVRKTANGYDLFDAEIYFAEEQMFYASLQDGIEGAAVNEAFERDSGVENPSLYAGDENDQFDQFVEQGSSLPEKDE